MIIVLSGAWSMRTTGSAAVLLSPTRVIGIGIVRLLMTLFARTFVLCILVLLHGSLHHVGQQHVVHAANRQGHGTLIVWHLGLSAKLLVFYPNAYVILHSGHYGGGYAGFQRQ